MRIHYPELHNMTHSFFNVSNAFKGNYFYISFAITAAGIVPCGGPKTSPLTASILQVMYLVWSFELIGNIL